MAGLAVPVWLAEDDLGCIICQGLLDWPATLPCGHSFCRDCLKNLWGARGAGGAGRPWTCPTCREGAAQQPRLRKNTLLQELADKYSRALRELGEDAAPASSPVPARAARPPHRPAPRQWNSQKLRLPPHAHCLIRASLHPRKPLGLLHGPSIQPLT
uniref:Ring finger protein 135 n=1 Tax=Propithecus coquereli TaxID=379532 RepID=A0A2K6G4R5_PROCO